MTAYELLQQRIAEALLDAYRHRKAAAVVDLEGIPYDVVAAAAGRFPVTRQNLVTPDSAFREAERLISKARECEEAAKRWHAEGCAGAAGGAARGARDYRARAERIFEALGLTKDGERRAPGEPPDGPGQPETPAVDAAARSSLPAPVADDGGGS